MKKMVFYLMTLFFVLSNVLASNKNAKFKNPGYLETYSVGVNRYPKSSIKHTYFKSVWITMNDIKQRDNLRDKQAAAFSGYSFSRSNPFKGFKPHTIKVSFTISPSKKLKIVKLSNPSDTPKKQIKYVKDLIIRTGKKLPKIPDSLKKSELTDTIVFNFT